MKYIFIVRYGAGILAMLGLLAAPAFAFASVSVSIGSLSPNNSITVGQNVSFQISASGFTSPSYSVSDSASDSSVSGSDIDSSGNFSWTPGNSDVGTHTLTITVSDSLGDTATTQETITVSAAPSLSVQSLSPGTTIVVGQSVSFIVGSTGFTNPTYALSDSFGNSTLANSDISSSGDFNWTPTTSAQDGTHTITITANDSSGHTASVSETIDVVSAPTVVIQSLSPGSSVNVGEEFTFFANASNFSNPTYEVSDSFNGSSVSNSDINSSGDFAWMPTLNDAGQHTITVVVNDASGHTATASQTITVSSGEGTGGTGDASVQGLEPGTTVIVGQPVTFTVAASDFTNPVFSVGDAFLGSSVSAGDINSAGYFSWTPTASDAGIHGLTIYVNDSSGHSGYVTLSLTVTQPSITVTSISPGTTVSPDSELTFTVSPQGFTNPSYTVSDSFPGSSVSDSDITSSGQFMWTPDASQDGTHTITVYATDSLGHSANGSIAIDVGSVAPTAAVTTTSTLGELEAELQADEAAIDSAGGSVSGASTSYVFTGDLAAGDSGSEVTQLQTVLAQQGDFSGTATGYYGSVTTAAVEKFQAAHGIAQIGVVGPETLAALNALMATPSSASVSSSSSATVGDGYVFSNFIGYGDTNNDVTELQKRLTAFGVYSGPITGYFGSLTQAAVKEFQSEHGIEQAGYVGPSTRAALNQ